MNSENYSDESGNGNGGYFLPKIISENDFAKITQKWQVKLAQTNAGKIAPADFENYFFDDCKNKILQVSFDSKSVHHLVSSVGVKFINARFALAHTQWPDKGKLKFTIALYGVDILGNRCSAYHLGQPVYPEPDKEKTGMIDGSIACNLADKWINNWENKATPHPGLFGTMYGNLNGYNYPMADFMNALYPFNIMSDEFGVWVILAAHDHISHLPGTDHHEIMTFGLVLRGINLILSQNVKTGSDSSSTTYYDLSLPSPPN